MALPKKFTEFVGLRLTKHTKKNLEKQAKIMEVKPAVAARIIVEHAVDGLKYEDKPIIFTAGRLEGVQGTGEAAK